MKLWIDVEDSAGARQGSGPITTALGWSYSELMDGAGMFGMEMPGQDSRAALASAKRVLRAHGIINGAVAELGSGIVDQRDLRVSGRGRSMLSLSGGNLLRELANLHVGSLTIDDGSGGTVVTGPSLIMALAPAGWSLDTTAGYANTIKAIYHQFEGESVLESLVRLAEITGEHFRLGTGRTVVWMRRNGSAKVLHGGITGTFTPGETVTGATSGATGTVQEATATYLYIESASGSFAAGESVAGAAGSVTATAVYNPDSGMRAMQGASSSRADSNTRICLIRNLDYVQDTFDTHIGRVYAYGVGNADSRITLDGETAPWAGWTVSSDTKGWFLQNDATWAAYGIERVVSWKDIDNATTLMELAYEWMLRRLSAQAFYRLSVVKLDAEINLGQTLRVIYHEWRDGYHAVDIDSNLIVLEKSSRINSDGVREVDLTVSTIDRFPEDDSSTSVGNMVNSRDYYQHDQPVDMGAISTLDTLTITRWLVVNESGGDNDTRFESQGDPNMFFLDASGSRIGLLTNDPHATLDVRGDVIIAGSLYVGDTSNAFSALGLTINQGSGQSELISLKSSTVAHGMTTETEDDTFGAMKKWSTDYGGLAIFAYGESWPGFSIIANVTTVQTGKSTSARGAVEIRGKMKSGTTVVDMPANANLLVLLNNATDTHIFDTDGDFWYTGALSSYKNSTSYTGYIFVPLAASLSSGSFNGDSFSTTAATLIDLSASFGAPAGIKAVSLHVTVRDSAAWGTPNLHMAFGPAAGNVNQCVARPAGGDVWIANSGVVPCDANGDIYYSIAASGANTFDAYILINGYFI